MMMMMMMMTMVVVVVVVVAAMMVTLKITAQLDKSKCTSSVQQASQGWGFPICAVTSRTL
jgi:hypothetical protein